MRIERKLRDRIERMKIEILQEELVKGLSIVSRAVANRPQLPVLANILIEAKKEGLTLAATDLELGIGVSLNAKVVEEGLITVPAKTLFEFVGSLNPGKVTLQLEKETLLVSAGAYKAKFQTIAADEFPKLPDSTEEKPLKVDCRVFSGASQMVTFASARDSLRPVLTGILMEIKKNSLKIVATDGFRLASRKIANVKYEGEATTLLVPMRAVSEVAKLESENELLISHVAKANQVIFRTSTARVVTQVIEGNYPDYNKIVPQEFLSEANIPREELLQAVKATHIFARENSNMMRWAITEKELTIKADSPERGGSEISVSISLEGEGGEVVFNTKFVLDFLQATEAQAIKFGMGEKLSPCAFREEGNEEMLYVVMPINA